MRKPPHRIERLVGFATQRVRRAAPYSTRTCGVGVCRVTARRPSLGEPGTQGFWKRAVVAIEPRMQRPHRQRRI